MPDASPIFLYNDVSSYFKAAGPNLFHFLCRYFCHQNASSKAFLNRMLKRPQLQADKDSGLSVQVNELTGLTQHDDSGYCLP